MKVQKSIEEFSTTNHNHHHNRPFDNDDDGPTTYMSFTTNQNNNTINLLTSSVHPAIQTHGGASPAILKPLQPFHISYATTATAATSTSLKYPAGRMAASLGFPPFTSAQWKELQRQAMVYKYMMASLPVPPHLLINPTATPTPTPTTSLDGGGFNLRLSSSSNDPEPGRCRRTDGKKWRCSRDVAPNHKYCERHMHRGRPRSRKPVEVHQPIIDNKNQNQIKRPRHDDDSNNTSPFPVPIPNTTATKHHGSSCYQKKKKHHGSSSHFLQPYFQSSLSLENNHHNNFAVKATNFGNLASVSSNKQPRGVEWMLNGDPVVSLADSESGGWQSLMHNKVSMSIGGCCHNTEPPQYLNSFALYSSGMDQEDRHLPMFFNPSLVPMESLQSEKPRGFIDAWSNSEAIENNTNKKNKNSAASSIGKLSLSSLDLSMGGGAVNEEDMGSIGMGLGLMEHDDDNTNNNDNDNTKTSLSNWLNPAAPWAASTSTPGGPLAEVLMPTTTVTATSVESSGGPLGTMASSPSGVLHKTFASFSDSSGNSSPTVASSSRASFDEIALFKFNQM